MDLQLIVSVIRRLWMLKKNAVLVIIMGFIYVSFETIFRAITGGIGDIAPEIGDINKYWVLMGYASAWMLPIGGLAGLVLGSFNEFSFLKHLRNWKKAILGGLAITAIELIFGLIFIVGLELPLWDYTHFADNFLGVIALRFTILWIGFSPFVFWLDDVLRHLIFDEPKPEGMWNYYNPLRKD
jgi:uncharacterized membrane protein